MEARSANKAKRARSLIETFTECGNDAKSDSYFTISNEEIKCIKAIANLQKAGRFQAN
jgi:hypothetical protein